MTAPRPISSLLRTDSEIPQQPPRPKTAQRPQMSEPSPQEANVDPDLEQISPTRRDLSASLPSDTALLKVVMTAVDGQDCFRLEGYFRGRVWVTNQEELRNQRRIDMILADEMDGPLGREAAIRCYAFLQAWSSTKYGLTQWLTTLRREAGPKLRLIVWDDTDFGIPWELFWHNMEDHVGWLGVVVQVVRWTTVHDANRHDQFSAKPSQSRGGEVLYYEDRDLAGPGFSICDSEGFGFTAMATMEDLLRTLAVKSKSYGLVYVRGHGVHSPDIFKAAIAGVHLSDLGCRALPALKESESVVFLNACNSARPVIDTRFGDNSNRNFAEIFLRQHAAAVIATMAEIPVAQSTALARGLVKRARSEGVQLSEYLRLHRAKYAAILPVHIMDLSGEEQDTIRAFLYASMFAFFGHPESIFKLG